MPEEQRIEEQLLSQGAEKIISDQVDKAEKIDVNVQTDLFKAVQGQVDGVSVAAKGLEMQGIRVQEMKLQTDNIAVNPLSALFGQIELNHPVDATGRIVLTEVDLNRAMTSDTVRSKMQKFDLNVEGEIVSLQPEMIQLNLLEGKMAFAGKVLLQHNDNTRRLGFTAEVRPRTHLQPIKLESFKCIEGDGFPFEVVVALMEKVKELLHQPYFQMEGMALRVREMQVQKGSLSLLVDARVTQIPST